MHCNPSPFQIALQASGIMHSAIAMHCNPSPFHIALQASGIMHSAIAMLMNTILASLVKCLLLAQLRLMVFCHLQEFFSRLLCMIHVWQRKTGRHTQTILLPYNCEKE